MSNGKMLCLRKAMVDDSFLVLSEPCELGILYSRTVLWRSSNLSAMFATGLGD
jgi:hypothetical protein